MTKRPTAPARIHPWGRARADDLEAPEGVVWVPGDALYVTESSLQFFQQPQDLRSHITRVSLSGEVTRVLTDTPTIDNAHVTFKIMGDAINDSSRDSDCA